jgi:alpha-L-fucosidase
LFTWPSGKLELAKVKQKIGKAYLLTASGHQSVKATQAGEQVIVALPAQAPGQMATVLVLETR